MSRKRRLRSRAAGPLAVVALMAACSGTPSADQPDGEAHEVPVRGGTLNLLGSHDIDFMDPNVSYHPYGALALRLWARQLFAHPAEKDRATQAVPDLAEALPTPGNGISADGLTYTITLRKGPMWNSSPPRPVTTADVVRGVKRACNPVQPSGALPVIEELLSGYREFCEQFVKVAPNPSDIADYISSTPLPGVEARDEGTLVFRLTHPATYFVDMLTLNTFSPAPAEWDAYLPGSLDLARHTLSSGPYRVDDYVPNRSIRFSRNPVWRPETDPVHKAYVDRVVIDETVSQESVQQQLQTGTAKADMAFDQDVPPAQIPGLLARRDPNLTLGAMSATLPYIVFNTVSPHNDGALQEAVVRQALSHGIRREALVQVLGGPVLNPPLTRVLPSSVVGGEHGFDLYPHDPERARAMLAEAGHPALTLRFLYSNQILGSRKIFQALKQDLAGIGVNVEGVFVSDADFHAKIEESPDAARRGDWDLSLGRWLSDWSGNAAVSFFRPLFRSDSIPPRGYDNGLYASPATDRLIDRATVAATEKEAAALWEQADRTVMADAAIYPITNPRLPNYHAGHVHNAVFLQDFLQYDPTNVWLSRDKQGG